MTTKRKLSRRLLRPLGAAELAADRAMKRRTHRLATLNPDELARARGGGILLPTLGQAKDPVRAVPIETVAIVFHDITWE